jgi:hypothetical protein
MYDVLPKNEKNFDFKSQGETTGLDYDGRFKCKCVLDIAGKHSLELEKTRLMADFANPTTGLQGISLTIATIRAKLVEWPSWWDEGNYGLGILDENIILEIYDDVQKAESDWRSELLRKAERAQEAKKAEEAARAEEAGESAEGK